MTFLALVMSFTLLLHSSPKRKRDKGVDEEQRERKLFDKSCSPTSSFLDALGRSFQIPAGITLGTANKVHVSGEQYFSADALNLLSMGFLQKASLILLANASDTLGPRHYLFIPFYWAGFVAQGERAQQDSKVPYKVPHLTHPPFTHERQPQHRDHPTLIRIVRGFFNVPQNYQHSRNCETGLPVYRPYPIRLESLTICR